MVKNIVNAIVEQMEKENLLNIEMKEYFTYRKMDYYYISTICWWDF